MLASTHQEFEKLHIALLVFCPISLFISLLSHESNIFFPQNIFCKKMSLHWPKWHQLWGFLQGWRHSFLSNFLSAQLKTIKATLSLVKSRLALGSPGWLVVHSVECHHAKNGLIHRQIIVDFPLVITSICDTIFKTRPDQMRKNWSCLQTSFDFYHYRWCTLGTTSGRM